MAAIPDAFLRRAIPVHGLRPADLPGKPAHIETCLSVHASKLYHMGFRQPVRRSTLADANERRDWRIHAALAQRLITQARTLYVDEELGLDLTNTVYALDSTTIALCLSVFPWAHHRWMQRCSTCGAFRVLSTGWQASVHALDMLLPDGAIYVVDPTMVAPSRGLLRHGVEHRARRRRIADRHHLRWTASTPVRITPNFCGASASRTPSPARRWSLPAATICALYKSRWQVELFFKWIKQHLRIKQFYGTSENAVKTQIWIAVSVYVLVAIVKKRLDLDASLYTLLQILSVTLFEKMPIHQALAGDENRCNASQITNQLNLFDF